MKIIKGLYELTDREVQLLGLILNGLSNKDLKESLGMSDAQLSRYKKFLIVKKVLDDVGMPIAFIDKVINCEQLWITFR